MGETTKQRSLSVLMVEDDVTFVKIVKHHLQTVQGWSFDFVWKESVEDALAELQTNRAFDVIITDYNFPGGSNGLDFCLQLGQLDYHIPIIFLTGTRDYKLAVDAMKLGVEDFLLKEDLSAPLLPRTILNVIERARRHKQLQAVEKRMQIAENRAQAIRELVVTVCHEFNNPLAAIKISADLLSRMLTDEASTKRLQDFDGHFRTIELEIKQLRDLNFEKIEFNTANADSAP